MELKIELKYDKSRDGVGASMESHLYCGDRFIELTYNFKLQYQSYSATQKKDNTTTLKIDLQTGDFFITKVYLENGRVSKHNKKNNFSVLSDIIYDSFINGHRNSRFWGVKLSNYYHKVVAFIEEKIKEELGDNGGFKIKNYYDKMFSSIVLFHLYKNKIKPHNNIFFNILYDYPKKKFLDANDRKYIPSVLDFYGIKNSYYIKELNNDEQDINISTLKCLSDMFGDNYLDFIKQIPLHICDDRIRPKHKYVLKNNKDKNTMVRLINNMVEDGKVEIVKKVYKLMELYDFMAQNNLRLNLSREVTDDYNTLFNIMNEYKKFFSRKTIYTYTYPKDFLEKIEEPIMFGGVEYRIKLLKNEIDFLQESVRMKNCLSTHFGNGISYTYLSVTDGCKTVDIQIKNNKINQIYGKANTRPPKEFSIVSELLLKRFKDYEPVSWAKESIEFKR